MRSVPVIAATTVFVLVLSIAWYSRGTVVAQDKPAPVLPRWEYKVETVNTVAVFQEEKKLNTLGSEGWELCATERNGKMEGVTFIIFKRPKH